MIPSDLGMGDDLAPAMGDLASPSSIVIVLIRVKLCWMLCYLLGRWGRRVCTSFIAGTLQSTPQVPRDINPVWKHTFTFTQLGRGDVLRLTLRDTGLLSSEHFAGTFGPKLVATATLKAKEDFEGYLEMVPIRDGFGEPVLKLVARFPGYNFTASLPAQGTTAAVREALSMTSPTLAVGMSGGAASAPVAAAVPDQATMAQQAFHSAPLPAEDTSADMPSCVGLPCSYAPALQPEPAAVGMSGGGGGSPQPEPAVVGMSGGAKEPQVEMSGGAPAGVGMSGGALAGVGMSGGDPSPWASYKMSSSSQPSSSPFFIDDWVFNLAKPNLILQKLAKMQDDDTEGMFPVGGFRNYNCWAAGFQLLPGDWGPEHIWGPFPRELLPESLPDVLARMELLWQDPLAQGWCAGVGVLVKLLQHMTARR